MSAPKLAWWRLLDRGPPYRIAICHAWDIVAAAKKLGADTPGRTARVYVPKLIEKLDASGLEVLELEVERMPSAYDRFDGAWVAYLEREFPRK